MFAKFLGLEGTEDSRFQPAAADLCTILSVARRAGALRLVRRAGFAAVQFGSDFRS